MVLKKNTRSQKASHQSNANLEGPVFTPIALLDPNFHNKINEQKSPVTILTDEALFHPPGTVRNIALRVNMTREANIPYLIVVVAPLRLIHSGSRHRNEHHAA